MSLAMQYTIVSVIILGALLWMGRGMLRLRRKSRACHGAKGDSIDDRKGARDGKDTGSACPGCALADTCRKNARH